MSVVVGGLTKIKVQTAEEGCRAAKLTDPARALLTPKATVAEFLAALIEAGCLRDGVALMAYSMPKREAVWWACLAAHSAVTESTSAAIKAALEAAEAWVYQPSEEKRRAAMARAQAAGFDHPAVWAAVGAFWSGGSMAPADAPIVPPPEHLTGLAVDGAVGLAAGAGEPAQVPVRLRRYLDQAIDIANGGSGRVGGVN
ncbi:MAG TPA: hypothetical protein VET85_06555 [Stellaceae bacterium]|nr:hypothetical protein [Stellaceae bacterium]